MNVQGTKMADSGQLRYTNINDLLHKCRIDYKGMKPSNVYKRLSSMRDLAEKAKNQGDEEMRYIMLKRWLNSVEWLKKTPEYRDDKTFNLVIMRVNQMDEVKNILAELNKRLEARYKRYSKQKMMEKNDCTEDMDLEIDMQARIDSAVDGPIKLPETPTKDPLTGDNEEIISCDRLFQLLQTVDSRHLIIDIRPRQDYQRSRILSDKCINIPNSEIKLGVLAQHFAKCLHKHDDKSLGLFFRRGPQYTDILILLDWNTNSKVLTSNNYLNILRKILEEWDPGIVYKKITILDGGYLEWVTRYPAFTTNPNVAEPSTNNVVDEMLEDIEYPDWLHSDDEDTIPKPSETKLTNLKRRESKKTMPTTATSTLNSDKIYLKHVDSETGNSNALLPEPMDIDEMPINNSTSLRQYKESSKVQPKRTTGVTMQNELVVKPTIDRSNKPAVLKSSASESKMVLKLMRQLNELAKNKEKLEGEILEHERSLRMQNSIKYRGSNEEEYIHGNLKSLYSKLEETEKSYTKLEDEFHKYQTGKESFKFNSAEQSEKDSLDLNLFVLKRRTKDIAVERKKLRDEKSMQNEYKELQSAKENDANIRKEPLKKDNSSMFSGLERSYSSPNLLQLGDRKAPRVDRSSKPQVSGCTQNGTVANENVKVSHISWANREERMTPVHGSVHPGITGLKNLGNSCYMNSIIQCLSNTTHLTKYFTDNLYIDDLNTSDSTTQGQVVEEVAQVIKALWRGQYKSISPHDLKITVGQYKLQFDSYEQQDSHEFLTFLLDWMHNDLKRVCKTSLETAIAEKEWDKAMKSQKSIISDLFFGQLRSTITCSSCKQGSTTYEIFNSLTTSLPHSNRCTLNDCVLRFVTGQKVLGWKCPKCKMPRDATKKFDFVKLAPIIVIHLNRFGESGGWLEKRNTSVDFPLTGFNLKPYLVMDADTATIPNIRNYSYSLYAMSNHYGTMEGGHYTAYCKNTTQNKWYKYDDQTVTEVTASHVKSQNTSAYLLFYTSYSS